MHDSLYDEGLCDSISIQPCRAAIGWSALTPRAWDNSVACRLNSERPWNGSKPTEVETRYVRAGRQDRKTDLPFLALPRAHQVNDNSAHIDDRKRP